MDVCPAADRWRLFLQSALEAEENAALDAHLDLCPACRERLEVLSRDETASDWRRLLTESGENPDSERDACILERIKTCPSSGSTEAGDTAHSARIVFPGATGPDAPLGRLGHFGIVEELGSGATGIVYRARDDQLERMVAIKVLRPELSVSRDALEHCLREARSADAIHHPSFVAIHDVKRPGEFPLPYIVMEFVDGEPLATSHRRACRQTVAEAVRIVGQIASGLARAHERGLIHRDVKPANIVIERQTRQAKLTDFGIARTIQPQGDGTTHSGATTRYAVGTPPYMSPEQLLGQPVDARTDVYGLGVTLYELLTGKQPFPADLAPDTIRRVCEEEPVAPRRHCPEVPRDLEVICLTAISRTRAKRYATAGELADDLDRFTSGRPIQARPVGGLERSFSWCRRNRLMSALLAAIMVLLTIGPLVGSAIWLSAVSARDSAKAARLDAARSAQERETLDQVVHMGRASQAYHDHRDSDALAALGKVPYSRRGLEVDLLEDALARRPRPIELIDVNEWGINAILVSPDGRFTVASGQDGRVARYSLADGQVKELAGREWSDEARRFRHFLPGVSVSKFTRLYDEALAERELAARYPDCFVGLCWVVPGVSLAGASYRGRGVVWDLEGGAEGLVLAHDRPLHTVAPSPEGRRILFGDDRGVVIVVDRASGSQSRVALEGGAVSAVATLPRGGWILGQEDGTVRLFTDDVRSGPVWRRLPGPVWGLDLAPDGRRLAVACGKPEVLLLELDEGLPPRPSSLEHIRLPESDQGAPAAAHAVRFSPDGQRLAAGDDLGRFLLWEVDSGKLVFARSGLSSQGRIQDRDDEALQLLPLPLRRRFTAMTFLPDGQGCLTGGDDTALWRWTLETSDGPTTFPTAPGALVDFDRADPRILWVAATDGQVRLFDADTGKPIGAGGGPAHVGPVSGLSVASKSGLAATCGHDGTVRFWRREKHRLRAAATTLRHSRPLRSVGLSPEGDRVAAYDAADELILWEVGSGRVLGRQSLREAGTGPAESGLVGFNVDGTQVAVLGPGQSCWRYSGRDLEPIRRAAVVAGNGGTALAWNPVEPGELATGDTARRVAFDPPRSVNRNVPDLDAAVAGLAFSADGTKVFAVTVSGRLTVCDSRGAGGVLTLSDPRPGPTSLRFDPTGTRLAVAHGDGVVTVWGTGNRQGAPPIRHAPGWTESVLLDETAAREIVTRDQAIAVDRRGRLWILYLRNSDPPGDDARTLVCLGHEQWRGGPYAEDVLHDAGALTDRQRDGYAHSLALELSDDAALAVETRWGHQYDGQVFLHRRPLGDGPGIRPPAEPLTTVGNWGSFSSLLLGRDGQPLVLHYSHDGHYFLRTSGGPGQWETERVGRQGDGSYNQAVVLPDGDLGIAFGTSRYNSDPGQATYLRLGSRPAREVPTRNGVIISLTVGSDGRPLVLTREPTLLERSHYAVLERAAEGDWTETTRFLSPIGGLSNLVCDRAGTLYTAGVDLRTKGLVLFRFDGQRWEARALGNDPDLPMGGVGHLTGHVRLDQEDRPLVVLVFSAGEGRLSVLRPTPGR